MGRHQAHSTDWEGVVWPGKKEQAKCCWLTCGALGTELVSCQQPAPCLEPCAGVCWRVGRNAGGCQASYQHR